MGRTTEEESPWYREYPLDGNAKMSTTPVPHQQVALEKMAEWYDSGQTQGGILSLPTGSGKSFVATHFLCKHPLSGGYRVLWLAHTHHLLEQALGAFDKTMMLVGKSKKKKHINTGGLWSRWPFQARKHKGERGHTTLYTTDRGAGA